MRRWQSWRGFWCGVGSLEAISCGRAVHHGGRGELIGADVVIREATLGPRLSFYSTAAVPQALIRFRGGAGEHCEIRRSLQSPGTRLAGRSFDMTD
jgi:hypothetical protein